MLLLKCLCLLSVFVAYINCFVTYYSGESTKAKAEKVEDVVSQGNNHTPIIAPFCVMMNQRSHATMVLDVLPASSVFILAELFPLVLVNSSNVAAATAAVTDVAVKVPAHSVAKKTGPWATSREPAKLWKQEIDGRNVFSLPQNCGQLLNPACVSVII